MRQNWRILHARHTWSSPRLAGFTIWPSTSSSSSTSASSLWSMNAIRCWAIQKWELTFRISSSKLLITSKSWCSVLLCQKKWRLPARNSYATKSISSSMRENWFFTVWPNSTSTSMRYPPAHSEQEVREINSLVGYLGFQPDDHLRQQGRSRKEINRAIEAEAVQSHLHPLSTQTGRTYQELWSLQGKWFSPSRCHWSLWQRYRYWESQLGHQLWYLLSDADFPTERDTYLHRVGRAGRFGTKGLAINFIRADEEENEDGGTDKAVLMDIQNGFKVKILELPKELDTSLYMW